MRKKEKGITLIALVITIIVLLILAGVTISTLTGENGIITQTSNAKEETIIGEEKEIIELATVQAMGTNQYGDIEKSELENGLDNYAEGNYQLDGDGPFKVTYIDTQHSYIVNTDGTIEEYYDVSYLKEGDYVEYIYDTADDYVLTTDSSVVSKNDVGSSQTVTQTSGLKWRIFNIDDISGEIELISDTPTNSTLVLGGSLGYINGVNIINDICEKQYSNQELGITARSINIDDIYNKMNALGNEYIETHTSTTETWENVVLPTLCLYENGLAIDSDTIKTNGLDVSDTYDFEISSWWTTGISSLIVTDSYVSLDNASSYFDNTIIYEMIFGNSRCYWTASRYASNTIMSNYCATFGIISVEDNLFNGGGLAGSNYYSKTIYSRYLRPIVTIKTSMLNNDCEKNEDGEWILSY